jgi:thiosulfate reductase cytochrome b subunit
MAKRSVKVYPRFERFWHWTQMALIFVLLFTGLAITGLHGGLDFGPAVIGHIIAALALIVLWIFAIFWHLTTGTWKHYVPTRDGLGRVVRFYVWGIFRGEHHPYRKAYWRKHNPLQSIAYLLLKVVLFPAIWITGLIALGWNLWETVPGATAWAQVVTNIHLLAAFAIAAFVIAHVYLLTVGHSFREHVRPMITGFDTIDLTAEEEAYLEADEPGRIKPRASS